MSSDANPTGEPLGIAWAYGAMLLAVLISSGNFIFGSLAVDSITAGVLAFWRTAIATLLMLPFFLRAGQSIVGYFRQHKLKAVALTLSGVVLPAWFIYLSLHSDTLIDLAVGYTLIPLMTVVLAASLLGERLRPLQGLGLALALLGALVLAFHGRIENLLQFDPHVGFLWMLAACFTRGLYLVLLKKWSMRPSSDGGLFVLLVAGAIVLAPTLVHQAVTELHPFDYSWQLWGSIAFVGVGMGALYLHLISYGTDRIGAVKASLFTYLLPVFVTTESILFLGVTIEPYQVGAAAIVMVGVFLVSWFRQEAPKPQAA